MNGHTKNYNLGMGTSEDLSNSLFYGMNTFIV